MFFKYIEEPHTLNIDSEMQINIILNACIFKVSSKST